MNEFENSYFRYCMDRVKKALEDDKIKGFSYDNFPDEMDMKRLIIKFEDDGEKEDEEENDSDGTQELS